MVFFPKKIMLLIPFFFNAENVICPAQTMRKSTPFLCLIAFHMYITKFLKLSVDTFLKTIYYYKSIGLTIICNIPQISK